MSADPPPPAEELLQMLIEQAEDLAILLMDRRGRVVWVNPGAERVLGADCVALIGLGVDRFFVPESVARGDPAYELEVARREGWSEDDRWQQRLDGGRFWASGRAYALRDAEGEVVGFAKVFRNRTPQREQLDTLANRAEAAARALRQRDLALATLAHELRTPLAPLRNTAELLRIACPDQPDLAGLIDRQVDLLGRLVNDLLDTARIGVGKLALETAPVVLQDVLHRAAEAVRPLHAARKNTLELLLHPWPVRIEADATRLLQVFVNLLHNAAKFTPPGGHVWMKLTIEAREAVVRVEDDGVGIPADMLGRIFETFTQVEAPRPGAGLGLGLGLVRELVALHGGTVQVSSDGVGRGSQFTVRLPLAGGGAPSPSS